MASGFRIYCALISAGLLVACGGGGGGSSSTSGATGGTGGTGGTGNTGVAGYSATLAPASTYAQQCAPDNPQAPSPRSGSLSTEKQWMRSYFNENYLWNTEVPLVDPNAGPYTGSDVATALENYFDALRTPQQTSTGARRDKFSFIMPTRDWQALAGSGQDVGYGLEWALASTTPPRHIRVAYVDNGGLAQASGIARGYELLSADGVSADAADTAGVNTLNDALYPDTTGRSHNFLFKRVDGTNVNITMSSLTATHSPVLVSEVLTGSDGARIGHLVFNDHLAPAEGPLINAIQSFKSQGVTDLVLDMRYNGGGYLYIASELAYMIAGPTRINGRPFEQLQYNARRAAENATTAFDNTSCFLTASNTCSSVAALPTLNLSRVFVLTQDGTCSASESVINGLLGVDVEVIQIGGTTCGKPYGFTAKDNCGYSYFPIEFAGVNAKGFGDYSDGFTPGGASIASSGRTLRGCAVNDDFSHALNDSAEGMLAGALRFRTTGQCPVALVKATAARGVEGAVPLVLRKGPALMNRIGGGRP